MDVVFAVVPFSDVRRPSIGVSTIQAGAKRAGFSVRIEYVGLQLAAWMGLDLFQWIVQLGDQLLLDSNRPSISLVGDWFFAEVLFPGQLPSEEEYLARFVAPDPRGRDRIEALVEARRLYAARFVEYAAAEILRHRPRVVGFTSTFYQTCCCLAVAKLLKQAPDPPAVILGGANCEGEMGQQLIQSFPWIDYICTGEGDDVALEFLDRFVRQGDPVPPRGILRQGAADELRLPSPITQMDETPVPEFHDYFEALAAAGLSGVEPILLVQTARGCWWGDKHHCTFCGLNGEGMAYRSKSAERAVSELIELSETYGLRRVDSVDNILDTRYISTLFPKLIERGVDLDLFYEVKANLRYEQLQTMRAGGVRAIQPGIESFSNSVLQTMRKGCTGLQNIQLLRWCDELDIFPSWNVLYGFPGEPVEDYERMAELIPLLTHLPPPGFCVRVRMDRFSPLYKQSAEFGLENVRPMEAYSYVFPLPESAIRNIAYFFEFDYRDGRRPAEYARALVERIEEWAALASAKPPRLDAYPVGGLLTIVDTRPCATKRQHFFTGLAAQVYRECDAAAKAPSLARRLAVPEDDVRKAIERFLKEKLMVEMDGQFLSLAIFRNREAAPASAESDLVQISSEARSHLARFAPAS
jgi:ribosomal peptide maturation radical SAM protein 1